jgi:CBS domain-containing protein
LLGLDSGKEVSMYALESILQSKGRTLHVVDPADTVLDAVDVMCHAHVGALLVMAEDALVGIFSERDLMTRVVLTRRDPDATRVAEVMTPAVHWVAPDTGPDEVLALMTDRRIRHVPVVDTRRRIIGVVSIGDLVRWTVRDREQEIEQLHGYVTGRYPG